MIKYLTLRADRETIKPHGLGASGETLDERINRRAELQPIHDALLRAYQLVRGHKCECFGRNLPVFGMVTIPVVEL